MASPANESAPLVGNFYRGRIVRLRFGSQTGAIRAESSGRVIPFRFDLVRLLGVQSFGELREGMTVGFDMSWTSGGLRVSVIKAFPAEEVESNAAPSNESAPSQQSQAGEDLDQD